MKDVCESCGNESDYSLRIEQDGRLHVFDCFECAIEILAPLCQHCGTKVIGHGLARGEKFFCCAHCAEADGKVADLRSTG